MEARCKKCGYEWETKSNHVYVTCPSCLAKVKIREVSYHSLTGGASIAGD